jgi:hypothetical protein
MYACLPACLTTSQSYHPLLHPIPQIQRIQEFNQKRFELGEVRVGRFETMDFMAQPQPSSAERKSENRTAEVPRFSVTLLDAANTAVR